METLDILRNIFHLQGKTIEWAVVEETSDTTELKPGLFIEGSRVYVDLYARRFYSTVRLPDIVERKVYPARKVNAEDGMFVLEAKDAPDKFVVLPKTFINDVFGTTIYGAWMEERLLL